MLKRLRKNHPLLYCIGAEAVFLGSLFVSSYLVVIALLLFRFNFAYADDYLLGCIQELVGIGVAVVLLVGASPNGQASFATLTHRCTSAARAMLLSGRPVMQINGT